MDMFVMSYASLVIHNNFTVYSSRKVEIGQAINAGPPAFESIPDIKLTNSIFPNLTSHPEQNLHLYLTTFSDPRELILRLDGNGCGKRESFGTPAQRDPFGERVSSKLLIRKPG